MNLRIGYGYDVHQLAEGHDFWLGGIKVPHSSGAIGHSDADVLIHVICDALLGASNMRDIGHHFPDTNAKYKGIDSKQLLTETISLVSEKGYEIVNIDSTICLQKPKINPYIPEMKEVLSQCMNIDAGQVSIKATTTENLGFVGKELGVSAHAIVLINKPT